MFQISLYLPRIKVKINSCFGVDHKEQNVAKAYLILLQFKHADPHIPKILHLFFAQWGAKMIRLGYRLDNQLLIVWLLAGESNCYVLLRPILELTDPPIQWVPDIVLLEHEDDRSLSSNVKVKNECCHAFIAST